MKKETGFFPAAHGRIALSVRALSAFIRLVAHHACEPAVRPLAVALLTLLPAATAFADSPDFRFDPPLAGRASLVEDGFVIKRELGVLAIAPELKIPIELVVGRFE